MMTGQSMRSAAFDLSVTHDYDKGLKALRGLTPFEHVVRCWTEEPERFRNNPTHHMPGLNT